MFCFHMSSKNPIVWALKLTKVTYMSNHCFFFFLLIPKYTAQVNVRNSFAAVETMCNNVETFRNKNVAAIICVLTGATSSSRLNSFQRNKCLYKVGGGQGASRPVQWLHQQMALDLLEYVWIRWNPLEFVRIRCVSDMLKMKYPQFWVL